MRGCALGPGALSSSPASIKSNAAPPPGRTTFLFLPLVHPKCARRKTDEGIPVSQEPQKTMLLSMGIRSHESPGGTGHLLLKAALKTRGAEMLWDTRHFASRPLPEVPGKSVDRHLAIFRDSHSSKPT